MIGEHEHQPVAWRDDALRELAGEVNEDAAQSDGEGPRLRPIDSGQELLVAPTLVELQIVILLQPAVQIQPATEAVEAVV